MQIQEKENDRDTKFIKEPEEPTKEFVFQKNKKTKIGFTIILVFLIILIAGIILSGVFFETNA